MGRSTDNWDTLIVFCPIANKLTRELIKSRRSAVPKQSHFTVSQIARLYDVAEHRVRKIIDELPEDIPRVGRYRLIRRELLGRIAVELQRRGWLPSSERESVSGCYQPAIEPAAEQRRTPGRGLPS